ADSFQTELALDLLDRLTRLVCPDLVERRAEDAARDIPHARHYALGSPVPLLRRRTTATAPAAAAAAPASIADLRFAPDPEPGAALFAFRLIAPLPICQTAHPKIALRLFKMLIALLSSGYSIKQVQLLCASPRC